MHAKHVFGILALISLSEMHGATIGMVSGQGDETTALTPYAALVDDQGKTSSLTELSTYPEGLIYSCAFNGFNGLIGGEDTLLQEPIVAIVSSSGTMQFIDPFSSGFIQAVDMNFNSLGIIVGQDNNMGPRPYAAFVSDTGQLTPVNGLPITGHLRFVGINQSGTAIVGGNTNYAALISPNGVITPATGLPITLTISGVDINDNGIGILGGRDLGVLAPYAALIPPNGVSLEILGIPASADTIRAAAINNSMGIIGGKAGYAAFVSLGGSPSPLSGIPSDAQFLGAAINQSGTAIIAGNTFVMGLEHPYAALVSPDGVVTALNGLPDKIGYINAAAINNAGVGIIAGRTQDSMFAPRNPLAALVAPNGTLTFLSFLPTFGDLLGTAIADLVVPITTGPYTNPHYALLSASKVVSDHYMIHHKHLWPSESKTKNEVGMLSQSNSLVVDASFGKRSIGQTEKKESQFNIWLTPFYDYIHQSHQEKIPSFNSQIAGVVAAIDYWPTDRIVVGGGLAYAFDYAHYSSSLGHAKINEEMAVLYTSYQGDYVFVDASVWGGIYQLNNVRHTPIIATTSKSNTDGWLLSPHLELCAAPYKKSYWFLWEPFVMFDWVNNWQKHFTEKGASGFNLIVDGQYNSLLRSEAGMRLYQVIRYDWGRLFFQEKASYINQAPFRFNSTTTSFVSSPSSFSIATGSNSVQNMGGIEFQTLFLPWNDKYPYGSISFQGEFGSTLQSYLARFEIGKKF